MDWVLFFIFLGTNLLSVLLCWYSYGKSGEYKEGMVHGVHILWSCLSRPDVQVICQKAKKTWKIFQWINLVISLLVCLLCLYDFTVFIIVWSVWLLLYIAGDYYLILAPHRKMYRLKMENGWLHEKSKKIVRIDTVVSAASDKLALRWQWHLPALILACGGAYLLRLADTKHAVSSEEAFPFWIMYASSLGISVLFLILHVGILRHPNKVYSDQTEINLAANRLTKHSWSVSLLSASWLNVISFLYLAVCYFRHGPSMPEMNYAVYFVLIISAAVFFLLPLGRSVKKRREVLTADPSPLFIDDDEYWKNGWYSNPNDPHILVQDRFNSINLSFNFAHTGVKVFVGALCALTAAIILWTVSLVSGFENAQVVFTREDGVYSFEAAGYECEFTRDDILSVTLTDKMPDDKFTRTNGGSGKDYQIGHFRGKETGKCMMFLTGDYTDILKIELKDMTVFASCPEGKTVESWYQELENES